MESSTAPGVRRIARDEARALEVAPWDKIAPLRARDLDSGRDLSFDHVIAPTVLDLVRGRKGPILDAGCGTGRLTRLLAQRGREVVGVDPSSVSADIAQKHVADLKNVTISACAIADMDEPGRRFGVVVASMVLQDVVDMQDFLFHCASRLRPNGRLVIAVTHPFFWSSYWGYASAPWFAYSKEFFLRTEFRISNSSSGIETMHCHRPLDMYAKALHRAGFYISDIREPVLPRDVQRTSGVTWTEPHFLFMRCERGPRAVRPTQPV